jgi:hypothetical protein
MDMREHMVKGTGAMIGSSRTWYMYIYGTTFFYLWSCFYFMHNICSALQEHITRKPLTGTAAWRLGKKKMKLTSPDEDPYYGKMSQDFEAYEKVFKKIHWEDSQPLEEEVDETAVIVAGIITQHGRYRILNSVIQPTTSLSRVHATSTSSSLSIPPRPRPGGSRLTDDVSCYP